MAKFGPESPNAEDIARAAEVNAAEVWPLRLIGVAGIAIALWALAAGQPGLAAVSAVLALIMFL